MIKLLTYSQQHNDYPAKRVEIHALLERSLNALSEDEKFQGISVQKIFCEDLMYVEDRGLLIVLRNLYRNAVQAMEGQGTLTIATWRQNGSVGVAIQDTGQGASEIVKEHLFEHSFRTKNKNKGIEIGSSLNREIVERCGGELRCGNVSDTNPGVRFTLTLPRKSSDPAREHDQST